MAHDILLEAGTNEMELLVFNLGDTPFGINVAKVREIIQRVKTIDVPYAGNAVEGAFQLRDEVLSLVNLGEYFGMVGEEIAKGEGMIIIVEFSHVKCGVLVDAVDVIKRLSWDCIEPPSRYLTAMGAPITGTVEIDGRTVLVADFETLVGSILGVQTAAMPEHFKDGGAAERKKVRIILADDSTVIRSSLKSILNRAGYDDLTICHDGKEAWDKIDARREEPNGPYDIVLTDIEMPQMDGLYLCKKIKEDSGLREIPVILFSSLISDDNLNKGRQVHADAQISKPDSQEMIDSIERLLATRGITFSTPTPQIPLDEEEEKAAALTA